MVSPRFTLLKTDIKAWLKNTLVFLAPALLVLIASAIKELPADAKYGVVVLYVLNVLMDILRKFVDGPVK